MRRLMTLALLLAPACIATETGNPVAPVEMSLIARSSDPSIAIGARSEGMVVEQAWVVLGRVRFVAANDCERPDTRFDWEGHSAFDLVGEPLAISTELERTAYCRLRLELARYEGALPDGAPSSLAEHSIVIRGARADGVPFEIRSRMHEELELRARDGAFEITGALLLAFDLGTWLSAIDLDSVAPVDGNIVIDETQNPDRLEVFETSVESALELFRDDDADRELDEEEEREPLTLR